MEISSTDSPYMGASRDMDLICNRCRRPFSRSQKHSAYWEGKRPELFAFPPRRDEWAGAHRTAIGSLLHGVQHGCYMCRYIFKAVPRELRRLAKYFRTFYKLRSIGDGRWMLHFTIELPSEVREAGGTPRVIECPGTFQVLLRSDNRELISGNPDMNDAVDVTTSPAMRSTSSNTSASQAYEQDIQSWLLACTRGDKNHSPCSQIMKVQATLPIRLLCMQDSIEGNLQLVDIKKGVKVPTYCTISHSRSHGGEERDIKLTTENLDDFRAGFSSSNLPKHFQAAIGFALSIKVRHLWIDTFCILQDSDEDRRAHSSAMGRIYSASYCNISSSSGLLGGLEGPARSGFVPELLVQLPEDTASEATHIVEYDDLWCSSLRDTDVGAQALAVQERLLSPRTIHIGLEQVFWECRAHKACDKYPNGIPREFTNARTREWNPTSGLYLAPGGNSAVRSRSWMQLIISWLRSPFTETKSLPRDHIHQFWAHAVQLFMQGSLENPANKLWDIQGIADMVKAARKEEYLAGLWNNDMLAQQLLWYVPSRQQASGHPSARSDNYRAPSWSWASMDADIIWDFYANCGRILIKIEEARVQRSADQGNGTIESAFIRVRGHLIPARIYAIHTFPDGQVNEDGSYAVMPRAEADEASKNDFARIPSAHEPTVYLDESLGDRTISDAYLLPVCREWKDYGGHTIGEVAGLIVRRHVRDGYTAYERLGVYALERSGLDLLRGQFGEHGDSLAGEVRMLGRQTVVLI